MLCIVVIIYANKLILITESSEKHVEILTKVLNKLKKKNLKINAE